MPKKQIRHIIIKVKKEGMMTCFFLKKSEGKIQKYKNVTHNVDIMCSAD